MEHRYLKTFNTNQPFDEGVLCLKSDENGTWWKWSDPPVVETAKCQKMPWMISTHASENFKRIGKGVRGGPPGPGVCVVALKTLPNQVRATKRATVCSPVASLTLNQPRNKPSGPNEAVFQNQLLLLTRGIPTVYFVCQRATHPHFLHYLLQRSQVMHLRASGSLLYTHSLYVLIYVPFYNLLSC